MRSQTGLCLRGLFSLAPDERRYAREPYSAWGGDTEDLMPRDTSLVVENPLQLPWDDHALMGLVPKRVEGEFLDNLLKSTLDESFYEHE